MLKFLHFSILLLFTVSSCLSQNITNYLDHYSSADLPNTAKEDSDIVIPRYTEEISFKLDKRANLIQVIKDVNQTFLNTGKRAKVPLTIFYDGQSNIQSVSVKSDDYQLGRYQFKDQYYNDDELFHTDIRVMWTSINLPIKGYTSSFSYTKKYEDIKYFISTYIDDLYEIRKKKIIINVPDWLELELKEMNLEDLTIVKNESTDSKKGVTRYEYIIENIKPTIKEESAPGPSYHRPHLLFLAKSFTTKDSTLTLLKNTQDLYNWYHSLIAQTNNDPEVLKEKTFDIIKDCKSQEEKIKAIFYWVQDNIRYIAFEDGIAGFKPDDAQNVYKKKYGDCKGMANLTKEMLKIAGFDARLTWLGTKRIAYDYSIPSIAVDNHMICTVIDGDNKYYLDSTEKYCSINGIAERIQDRQVLIENGEDYILEKTPKSDSKRNTEIYSGEFTIEGDQLKGKINRSYTGESLSHFLYSINQIRTDKRNLALEYYIKRDDKNIIVENISFSDLQVRDKKMNLSYNISIENSISSFGNEIYVDLDFIKEYNSLDLTDRNIDFLFPYKTFEETTLKIKIPAGYKVKEMPENIKVSNEDFDISLSYEKVGGEVLYRKVFNFKNSSIGKQNLSNWNDFYKKLKEFYQKQLILTKS